MSTNVNSQSTPKKTEEVKQTQFKPAEASEAKTQTSTLTNAFGNKETKAENKISFGAQSRSSASPQAVSETNKTIPNFTDEKKENKAINIIKAEKEKIVSDTSKITLSLNTGLASEEDKKLADDKSI